jgi:sugar lactone lactonase YvrE
MTPAVVDIAFVEDSVRQEVRQPGRLAKTVGLDTGKAYRLRYVIGDADEGVVAKSSDFLKKATGNGLTPLVKAEGGTVSGMDFWGDLTLRSNSATFQSSTSGTSTLSDLYNPKSVSGHYTTTGEAEYNIANVGSIGTTGKAYFKMEYVPFGKLDPSAWANSTDFHTGVNPAALPVWVIRNGLDDTSGAIDFGVVAAGGVSAQIVPGLYEDNNPNPIATAMTGTSASDLITALTALNTLGATARYGTYTVKLGKSPTVPDYPGKITSGGTASGTWKYPNIERTELVIDGAGGTINLLAAEKLWTLLDGTTLRYGPHVHILSMLVVSTIAGTGIAGSDNGPAETAKFNGPQGIAVDSDGNLDVTEYTGNRIRKLTKAENYAVSTLAGTGSSGANNGDAETATFWYPHGITIDGDGNLYVTEFAINRIRKLTKAENYKVSTLAGTGSSSGNNGDAETATFYNPTGITIDGDGNLLVAEAAGKRIRKLTKAENYKVSTLAGTGGAGATNGNAATATFNVLYGIAVDGDGNVFVPDPLNHCIRKLTKAENYKVSSLAQNSFNYAYGIAVDGDGNLYVGDINDLRIRKLTKANNYAVSNLAGTGASGATNGDAVTEATFKQPSVIAVDGDGTMYVADFTDNRIRKIAWE